MTPAQRATLETMAATTEAAPGAAREVLAAAKAVRAALAEVDRLNEVVGDLRKPRDTSEAAMLLRSAENDALRAEVADLRSRAIPKDADFTLYVTLSHDRFMVTNERVDAPRLTLRTYLIGSAVDKGPFPTLAAALAAADGDDHE